MPSRRQQTTAGGTGSKATRNQAIVTPLAADEVPSLTQQAARIEAFREMLGYLGANLEQQDLVTILTGQRWDLAASVLQFHLELPGLRANHLENRPSRSQVQQARERLLEAPTLHEHNRRAIDQLFLNLEASDLNDRIEPLRAALLLVNSKWNLDAAYTRHCERAHDPSTAAEDASRELRLRIRQHNGDEANACHRGERLAMFVMILGTDDWFAARAFLNTHGFDLARAVEKWLRIGLPANNPAPNANMGTTYHRPELPHTESTNMWPTGRPLAMPLENLAPTSDDYNDAGYDYKEVGTPYADRTGWLINYDQKPAKPGLRVESKARVHYILREKGRREDFNGAKQFGTGEMARDGQPAFPTQPEEMDWDSPGHITSLNKWRTQFLRRVGGVTYKITTAFHHSEEQFLYDWHMEQYLAWLEAAAANPQVLENGGRVFFDTFELYQDFNNTFENTTHLSDTNGIPRPERSEASLDMKRRRIPAICREFGVPSSIKRPGKLESEDGEELVMNDVILRGEVTFVVTQITPNNMNEWQWDRAMEVVEFFFLSGQGPDEIASIRRLLTHVGFINVDPTASTQEEFRAMVKTQIDTLAARGAPSGYID